MTLKLTADFLWGFSLDSKAPTVSSSICSPLRKESRQFDSGKVVQGKLAAVADDNAENYSRQMRLDAQPS